MFFSNSFICYSEEKNEYERHVNAPLFKRTFTLTNTSPAKLSICGLGFYRAFLNGVEITKGRLAPYVSNTDEAVYYDEYAVDGFLKIGENVLEILLGNGCQNPIGGEVWDFHKGKWCSSPKLACAFTLGGEVLFEADERFLVSPSKITFDDLWAGEFYDARLKYRFRAAKKTEPPKGEKRPAAVYKVEVKKEIAPVAIYPCEKGFVYDFGVNSAGICRLKVNALAGQKIFLYHFEIFENGKIRGENIAFGKRTREGYWQRDEYITKEGENVYEPSFTYHGFRYVYVEGLEPLQATKDALTMLVLTTNAKQKLLFSCSDKRVEKLVENVLNSNYSNFMYFPTDCPQREKNGWTGDAMLSAEQMLLSMNVRALLKEWLFNIRKAQADNGALPRIVPTGEWGYISGESGPNWDGVLIELPYRIYEIENDESPILENLPAIEKYLRYINGKRNENGLLRFGLGDREETFSPESSAHQTPNYITDTLTAISLCEKTVKMAQVVKNRQTEVYAEELRQSLIFDFRAHCVDDKLCVKPYTQTGQCLALYAGVFKKKEKKKAFENLLSLIKQDGGRPRMGMIGYRYLFDVLAENGKTDFAYQMLLSEEYTGYLYYVKMGMTSMIESFAEFKDGTHVRVDGGKIPSLNHHWYGHILASLIKYIVGIRIDGDEKGKLKISPTFIKGLGGISTKTEIFGKEISVSWQRNSKGIVVTVETELPYSFVGFETKEIIGKYKTEYHIREN